MNIVPKQNGYLVNMTKNEVLTKIDELIRYIDRNHDVGRIEVCVYYPNDRNSTLVPYCYTPEETAKLMKLYSVLYNYNIKNTILFSEGYDHTPFTNDAPYWTFETVISVNQKIDKIVQKIKDMDLTPFQTLLYIHKICNDIPYSNNKKTYEDRELNATVLGLAGGYPALCCAGYASLVKTIIDRLNNPNLQAEMKSFAIYDTQKPTQSHDFLSGHVVNFVHIRDSEYGIDGTFYEDATPIPHSNSHVPILSFCAMPIADMHCMPWIFRHTDAGDSNKFIFSGVTPEQQPRIFENPSIADRNAYLRSRSILYSYRYDKKGFGGDDYTHIPIDAFENAYDEVLEKLGVVAYQRQTDEVMYLTVKHAKQEFTPHAVNCFATAPLSLNQ